MIQIKCRKCNSWNNGGDYCKNCNAVISMREQERLETKAKQDAEDAKPDDKLDIIIKKYRHHKYFIVRAIFYVFYSIYLIFAAIGAFLAWLLVMSQG